MKKPSAKYEMRDVDTRRVSWIAGGLVGILVLCCLISAIYFKILAVRTERVDGPILSPLATRMREFPEPRLQLKPASDLHRLQEREEEILNHYRWIDRQAGVVGIPIEQAMKLLVERGLPADKSGGELTWREVLQQRAQERKSGSGEKGGEP